LSLASSINGLELRTPRTHVFAAFRLLLCVVVAMLPFLSAPAQASVETPHHMHMSHDLTGHEMHESHAMDHDRADHPDCCDLSDICTHDHCTMNAFQMFGLLKSAETGLTQVMKMSWANDIIAQRDGHRPLLDPPIP